MIVLPLEGTPPSPQTRAQGGPVICNCKLEMIINVSFLACVRTMTELDSETNKNDEASKIKV